MKRIISCLLALMMLISLAPATFAAVEADVKLIVEANKSSAVLNEEVTFSVYLETADPFTGFQFDLSFPSGTEYIAASGKIPDGLKAQMCFAEASFTEATKRATFGNDLPYTANGRLKVAEFKGKLTTENASGYDIGLADASAYDADFEDLSVEIIPAHIDITIPVTGVSLNKSETSIIIGKTETLTASVTPDNASNKKVTWSSTDSSVASVANGVVTANKVGTTTISAKTEDGGKVASCVVTVTPKTTPVCAAPTNVTAVYGQKLSEITLSNPAGNTQGSWSWINGNTAVGNVGTKTFKAKFTPENTADFATVENIDVSVVVSAKTITVSVADIAKQTYTGGKLTPTVTVTGDGKTLTLNTDYTVAYGANTDVGEGTVTVSAKVGGNYSFANASKSFSIVPADGKLSINGNLNVTYGTLVPDVAVNKNGSDGAVKVYYYTDANCTTGKTETKPTNVGSYWVRAEMDAGKNYGSAVSNILNFAISRANITPSVSIDGWTYSETAKSPSVSGNSGNGTVTYKYKAKGAADSTYTAAVPVNAGDYTVKAEIAQSANYNAASATADFAIAKKSVTADMIANVDSVKYTGNDIKPTPSVTDGKTLVNNTDFTYSYANNRYVGVAKVTITGKGNYTGTADKEFSITAVDQAPAVTPTVSLTRDGHKVDLKPLVANAQGNVSFAISGEANGCSIENGILTSGISAGTVKVTVSVSAKDVNGDSINEYNAVTKTDAITVTVNDKAAQSALNITNAAKVTCGDKLTLTSDGGSGTGEITYALTNGTGEATLEGNVLTAVKGGTVSVIATKAEDSEYNSISSAPFVITVEKIKVEIPLEDTTVYTYNGEEQTYNIQENSAYNVTGNVQTNANEIGYTVSVELKNTDTHIWSDASSEIKNYNFVIKKATITIAAADKEIYTGEIAPELGEGDYVIEGLAEGEELKTLPIIAYETEPDTSASGSFAIKVSDAEAPDGGNYNDIVYVDGTLTISRKPTSNKGGGLQAGGTINRPQNEEDKKPTVIIPESPEVSTDKEKFIDLSNHIWAADSINALANEGIIKGTSENTFSPANNITRADFAILLVRAFKLESDITENFADVLVGDYFAKELAIARNTGIVNGIGDNKYAPYNTITRQDMMVIVYRALTKLGVELESTDVSYDDFEDVADYAQDAVKALITSGLVNGKSGKIAPTDYTTRAEVAVLIKRILDYIK